MDQGVDELKLKVNELESKFKASDEPSNASGQTRASQREQESYDAQMATAIQQSLDMQGSSSGAMPDTAYMMMAAQQQTAQYSANDEAYMLMMAQQ